MIELAGDSDGVVEALIGLRRRETKEEAVHGGAQLGRVVRDIGQMDLGERHPHSFAEAPAGWTREVVGQ